MAAEHGNPFDPVHLFGHVKDSTYFEVPRAIASDGRLEIPQPLETATPIWGGYGSIEPFDLKLTKFMVLEALAAVLIAVAFIWVANRITSGQRPQGKPWNLLEAFLLFVRDQIARPAIGAHDADRFVPFLWTVFFFILVCNLMGLVPWAGSPTGAFATTGALALCTFAVVIGSGMKALGPLGFWKAQVPHMDLPGPLGYVLVPMIFVIEVLGLGIKHFVLAVRLLANMLGGHMVLAVVFAFIAAGFQVNLAAGAGIGLASVLGATALNLLELMVAFIQAYVFTFLSALFIGMAVHAH
jgi:F-type H+-transporting ATPase subunit a